MNVVILTHTCPRFKGDQAAAFMKGLGNSFVGVGMNSWMLTPFDMGFKPDPERTYRLLTYRYIWPDAWHRLGYSRTLANDMDVRWVSLLLSPFLIVSAIVNLWRLVKREKIDVINAHWIVPNGFIGAVVSKLTGAKLVPTLPGSDVFLAQQNPVYGWMARVAANQASAITTNSPQLGKDLVGLGADPMKLSTIIYGVDTDEIYPSQKGVVAKRKELGVKPDELLILAVGRLVAKKGFPYLIKAMPHILKSVPKATLVIIGDGDQRAELEALVDKLKLRESVVMPGFATRDQIQVLYNAADAFVLPSIRDDAGNLDDQSVALVEAMATGTPVVATNFPGYGIVIEEGKNGHLTKERDPDDIARALIDILKDPKRRKAMADRSLELIQQKFAWPAIAKQYKTLFEQIVKDPTYSFQLDKLEAYRRPYSSLQPTIVSDDAGRNRIAKQLVGLLKNRYSNRLKQLRVLDVGCAGGQITAAVGTLVQEIVGIDPDKSAIDHALYTYSAPRRVSFQVADTLKLPFPDESFDLVINNQVYEFVRDDRKMMAELRRVLKPGGEVLFGARNKWALIEAQYRLPFLSWLPEALQTPYVRLLGRGSIYHGRYRSYSGLRELVKDFQIDEYTLRILRDPIKYGFNQYQRYAWIARLLPLEWFRACLPNYLWFLKK